MSRTLIASSPRSPFDVRGRILWKQFCPDQNGTVSAAEGYENNGYEWWADANGSIAEVCCPLIFPRNNSSIAYLLFDQTRAEGITRCSTSVLVRRGASVGFPRSLCTFTRDGKIIYA